MVTDSPRPLRLAEAAGVLSLATDLSMGQPLEHGLRTAVVAVRMAQAMGLCVDDQVTVFYTGVLHFAGCTAESEIDARFFGDEIAARPQMLGAQFGSRRELMTMAMRTAYSGEPAADAGGDDGPLGGGRHGRVPQVGGQSLRRGPDARRADGLLGARPGVAAAPVRALGWQGHAR